MKRKIRRAQRVVLNNIEQLDDSALRFAYGVTYMHGEQGNTLLAQLAQFFEQEYLRRGLESEDHRRFRIRRGRAPLKPKTIEEALFQEFSAAEIKEAILIFRVLHATFDKVRLESSIKFFDHVISRLSLQAGPVGQA